MRVDKVSSEREVLTTCKAHESWTSYNGLSLPCTSVQLKSPAFAGSASRGCRSPPSAAIRVDVDRRGAVEAGVIGDRCLDPGGQRLESGLFDRLHPVIADRDGGRRGAEKAD